MSTLQRAKKGAACKECVRRKRKCNHPFLAVQRTALPPPQRFSPLIYIPTSKETQLSSRLVDTIHCLRLDHLWLNLVPRRLGTHDAVDSAIAALVHNRDPSPDDSFLSPSPSPSGVQNYMRAVVRLRQHMTDPTASLNDSSLLTVALLCVCEALQKTDDLTACFSHWCGMRAILLSRPASWPVSDLARAILYHIRNQTFHIPVALGIASPFDEPRWYTLDPVALPGATAATLRLKRASHELLIRLPRLIAMVRRVREGEKGVRDQAVGLAGELLRLRDAEAESKVLHRVKIVRTVDVEQRALVPFSFEYPDLGVMETAVVYWKFFLLLFNIVLKLGELFPAVDDDDGAGFDGPAIKDEMKRMSADVVMSWQFARPRKQRAHSKGHVAFPTALLILYGVYRHMDDLRDVPIQRWREWTLDRVNEVNAVWGLVSTEDDLEESNELFLGGPLTGLFVAAYSEVPFWVRYQHSQAVP